jgi:hypothetical protein
MPLPLPLSTPWLASCLALALPAAALFAAGRSPASGHWGGDTLVVEVGADGADVEFECATGRISGPIKLDRQGDFDLPGSFVVEGHGPVRDGPKAAPKVRYQGHVDGDTMTITVLRGNDRLGPYTVTRGRQTFLKKCR